MRDNDVVEPKVPVALLGTGRMGAAFVDRWSSALRPVTVWNRTLAYAQALERSGVSAASTPAVAVLDKDFVVTMVTSGGALRSIALDQGVLECMNPGSTFIDLSTVDLQSSQAVAERASKCGVSYVRGAVSGTPDVVRSGSSALLLSGEGDAISEALPILTEITQSIRIVGDADQARIIKIAVNSMLAGTMQMLSEAVVLSEAWGVPREDFLGALESTVISSRFSSYKAQALVKRDFSPTFAVTDMSKDVALALDLGERADIHMSVAAAAQRGLESAINLGYGSEDFLAVICSVQEMAGKPRDSIRSGIQS